MQSRSPVPVRPVYPARSAQFLQRAAWAAIRASIGAPSRDPVATARSLYPDDPVPALVLQRAAVTGARTDMPGWAQELAQSATSDFLAGLGPQSAMSEVIRRGTVIPLGDYAEVTVPGRAPTVVGGWVLESWPIPVAAMPISPTVLAPKKCAVCVVLTRELAQYAGGQTVVTTMLREAAGVIVDSVYLSTAAASTAGLAGLLNGVTPLATAGDPLGDLGQLAAAVHGTDGNGETIFIASPGLAASLMLRNDHKATVLPSVAVPSTRLVAIDPAGVIHGINPVVDLTAGEEATIVMQDDPTHVGVPGSPPVVGAPTQSMFQTAQIAMRLVVDLSFAKRRAAAVQYVDAIAWT